MKHQGWVFVASLFFIGLLPQAFFLPVRAEASEDYSFQWLDPDKKIYVLQNRRYEKSGQLLLSLMGGFGGNSAYKTTYNLDPRMAYYFTEEWGVEAFFIFSRNNNNNSLRALKRSSPQAIPVLREVTNQYGGLLHWAPWYAKINFFNWILYFDWYLTAGLGLSQTDVDLNTKATGAPQILKESLVTYYVGTGHQFHLTERWVFRMDFLAGFYRAPVFGNEGESVWFSNIGFDLGVGLRL
jgi:outer membrane beta-barrel protein